MPQLLDTADKPRYGGELIFAVPSALTYTYGRMARDQRHGWAIWGAMSILFFAGVVACRCVQDGGCCGDVSCPKEACP